MPIVEYESDIHGRPVEYEADLTPHDGMYLPRDATNLVKAVMAALPCMTGYWLGIEGGKKTLRVRFLHVKDCDPAEAASRAFKVVLRDCVEFGVADPPLKCLTLPPAPKSEQATVIHRDGGVSVSAQTEASDLVRAAAARGRLALQGESPLSLTGDFIVGASTAKAG